MGLAPSRGAYHVEESHARAHALVLFDDAGVAHGHVEAGERHHAGAEREVDVVKRRALEVAHGLRGIR